MARNKEESAPADGWARKSMIERTLVGQEDILSNVMSELGISKVKAQDNLRRAGLFEHSYYEN